VSELERWQQRFEDACVHSPKACAYLAARHITPAMRARWGIGYCKEHTETYKILYKRLTFPIYNWQGELLSFSGRTLRSNYTGAKYIGLADNDSFKKSEQLYGLHYAMPHIAKSRVAIVCEGFTDVIGLHDLCGVQNAVGSMGVALTKRQVLLLARWAKLVIVVLDGDAAGLRATEKLLLKLKDTPVTIKAVRLPNELDPFDMAKEMGPAFAQWLLAQVKNSNFHV
jgi:DNA primase